ncbi:MAG: nucleoside kinase, partial [Lachnospiraceae bacterium]|nr:nucleoside kinase [Lachnospiraceae bacterium]
MRKVIVTIANEEYEYEAGIMYEQIAKDFQKDYEAKIVLVSADGRLRELHKILSNDCTIEFITLADKIGMETYRRSATFLLVKAVQDVLGDDGKNHLVAQYTVGRGLLCKLIDAEPSEQFLRSVHARMDELISQNIPIWKSSYSVEEARRIFAEAGMEDKVKLFKFRRASKVNVYSIGDYKDYYYGYMVPSTGYITHYELYPYDEGIILQLPSRHSPNVV